MSLQFRATAETVTLGLLASFGAGNLVALALSAAPPWVGFAALGASWVGCAILTAAHLHKMWTWSTQARQTVEALYLTRAQTAQLIRDGWGADYTTGWDHAISEAVRRLAPDHFEGDE